jgi:phosphohistidine phosphatase
VEVFLVRHADAVDETPRVRDEHRHLSLEGRAQARALGDRLRWHDCQPTHLWTSPYARAVQTAELVGGVVAPDVAVHVEPELAHGGKPRDVLAALKALPPHACVILFGHEPGLSSLGALLVGAHEFPILARAQACRIVDGALRWRFAWNDEAAEPHR